MDEFIKKLTGEVDKLQSLLHENEQGMSTWWIFLGERMGNIQKLWKEGPGKH